MKDAFIIISVIDFPERSLSYSSVRSTYTPTERLQQTIETIDSVKKHYPEAVIYLVEAGMRDYKEKFIDQGVTYIYCGDIPKIKRAINSKLKALGERAAMIYGLEQIKTDTGIRSIFKLSGRYFLNENFSLSNWHTGRFNFKQVGNVYSTRLYSFPFQSINAFIHLLRAGWLYAILGFSFERILHLLVPKHIINLVEPLGVSGMVAVNGDIIEE